MMTGGAGDAAIWQLTGRNPAEAGRRPYRRVGQEAGRPTSARTRSTRSAAATMSDAGVMAVRQGNQNQSTPFGVRQGHDVLAQRGGGGIDDGEDVRTAP